MTHTIICGCVGYSLSRQSFLLNTARFIGMVLCHVSLCVCHLRHACTCYAFFPCIFSGAIAQSEVVRRLQDIRANRRARSVNRAGASASKPAEKTTLKVFAGWKHASGRGCSRQIVISQGGGTHTIDVSKSASLEEVTSDIVKLFFPNGRNICQGLWLKDLTTSVTKYDGASLFDAGQATFGEVANGMKTRPIRVYLNTKTANSEDTDPPARRRRIEAASNALLSDDDDDEDLPAIVFRRGNQPRTPADTNVADTNWGTNQLTSHADVGGETIRGTSGTAHADVGGDTNRDTIGTARADVGVETIRDTSGAARADVGGEPIQGTSGTARADVGGETIRDTNGTAHADVGGEPIRGTSGTARADVGGETIRDTNGTGHADVGGETIRDTKGTAHADVGGETIRDTNGTAQADVGGESIRGTSGTARADVGGEPHVEDVSVADQQGHLAATRPADMQSAGSADVAGPSLPEASDAEDGIESGTPTVNGSSPVTA